MFAASALIFVSGELRGAMVAAWVAVVTIFAAVALVSKANGVLSPISIFVIVTALYLVSPAIRVILNNTPPIIDPSLYFGTMYPLGAFYIIAAIVAYQLVRPSITRKRRFNPTPIQLAYAGLVASSVITAYCISAIVDAGNLLGAGRGLVMQSVSTSTRALSILSAASLAWLATAFIEGRQSYRYPAYWALLIGAWACAFAITTVFLLGERRIVLSALVAFIVVAPLSIRTKSKIVGLSLPVIYLLLAYSAFRAYPFYEWSRIAQSIDYFGLLDISSGEFGAWATIAQDILSRPFASVSGFSFLTAPLSVIPSAIFPDRPLAPGLAYIAEYHPAIADIGGGMAFSFILESYLNFWVLGPVIVGGACGVILAVAQRSTGALLIAVFVLTFSFRFDLVSLLQLAVWTGIAVVMLSSIARLRVGSR